MILRPISEEVETNKVIRRFSPSNEEIARIRKKQILMDKNIEYKPDNSNLAKEPMTKDPKKLHDYQKVSLVSGNSFESLARTNPELFDREKLKILEYSKNLVEEFNEFMKAVYGKDIDRLEEFIKEIENNHDNSDINKKFTAKFNTFIYKEFYNTYIELRKDMSEEDAYKILMGNYFPEGLSEDGIKKSIKLRLDNNKALSDSLNTMLKQNYMLLNISKAEADILSSDLEKDSKNADALGRIKKIFQNPELLEKYKSKDSNYDFRPLGGAYVIYSNDGDNFKDLDNPSKLLHYIFKYDCIVDCHGNVDTDAHLIKDKDGNYRYQYSQTKPSYNAKELNDVGKEVIPIANQINNVLATMYGLHGLDDNEKQYLANVHRAIKDIIKDPNKYNKKSKASSAHAIINHLNAIFKDHEDDWRIRYRNYNDFVASFEECLNSIKGLFKILDAKTDPRLNFKNGSALSWTCQPVNTLTKTNIVYIVELIRTLKQEGFKNILIMNCNPNGITLPADIRNDKNFKVTYSKTDTIMETNFETLLDELNILEINLMKNSIDIGGASNCYIIHKCSLDDLQIMYEDTILQMMNEGVIDKIKELAKKALQIIIDIWRRLIGFIKKIINSLKEKLGFHSNNNENFKKPIRITSIRIDGSNKASIVTTDCKNSQEVSKAAEISINSIKNAIETTMKREITCMQKYNAIIQRNNNLNRNQ